MKKSQLSLKPTDLVVVGGVILVWILGYVLFKPQITQLQGSLTTESIKAQEASQLHERYTNLQSAVSLLPQYSKQIDLLSAAFPNEEQSAQALVQLQTMADRSGLALNNVSPAQSKSGVVSVTAVFKGSYQSYQNLMKEINNNVRPITIRSMSLTTESDLQRNVINGNFVFDFPYSASAASPAQ